MTRTNLETASTKIKMVAATAATTRAGALVGQAGHEYARIDAQNGVGNGWG